MNTVNSNLDQEELDGLTNELDSSLENYPIDTFLIRNEARTVYEVLRRIDQQQFIMDPEFQREFLWDEVQQSRLVESVLMRIPLPVFYFAEDESGRMIVVDGLQRLSTFLRFIRNELTLNLPNRPDLNQKRFKDLSPKLQNRFEDCVLIIYVIDTRVPEQARLDIFERLNSGVALTRQQMRNSLYSGPATRFLKNEARSELFTQVTGGGLQTRTMRDCEFVNRFCAFQLFGDEEYRGDMDDFLAKALKKMNKLSENELETLKSEFRNGLNNNFSVFDKNAFRKHTEIQGRRSSVINASLWDVMITGLSRQPLHIVEARKNDLRMAFYRLMNDEYFIRAITYSTNDIPRVRDRFELTRRIFQEVFGVNPT